MADKNTISSDTLSAEYSAVYHYVLSLCRDKNEAEVIYPGDIFKGHEALVVL